MSIRLSKTDRRNIESNHELMDRIFTADLIATVHRRTGIKHALWKRPLEEIEARGLPTNIWVLTFEIATDLEQQEFRVMVDRIKHSDDPLIL
jgi:hypothetical protein